MNQGSGARGGSAYNLESVIRELNERRHAAAVGPWPSILLWFVGGEAHDWVTDGSRGRRVAKAWFEGSHAVCSVSTRSEETNRD